MSGLEYEEYATVRSCCGCLSYTCTNSYDALSYRNETYWTIDDEKDVDQHCCLNCEGKVFAEGDEMELSTTETGECATKVRTTCLYNPGNFISEIF